MNFRFKLSKLYYDDMNNQMMMWIMLHFGKRHFWTMRRECLRFIGKKRKLTICSLTHKTHTHTRTSYIRTKKKKVEQLFVWFMLWINPIILKIIFCSYNWIIWNKIALFWEYFITGWTKINYEHTDKWNSCRFLVDCSLYFHNFETWGNCSICNVCFIWELCR